MVMHNKVAQERLDVILGEALGLPEGKSMTVKCRDADAAVRTRYAIYNRLRTRGIDSVKLQILGSSVRITKRPIDIIEWGPE